MARKLFPLVAAAAVLAGAAAAASRGSSEDAAELARGKAIFLSQGCYQCHGYAGQGSIASGPALVRLPLDAAGFVQYLRHPAGVMPAFSAKLLPPQDMAPLLAYVRALAPGRPAAQIPLLARYVAASPGAPVERIAPAWIERGVRAQEGRRLYVADCSACHGAERQGVIGPNLQSVGTRFSDLQVLHILLAPPPGMPKLSPQPLSVADMRKIAAYIRTPG